MTRIAVMTTEELRYWMRELHEHHGWTYNCLARTLRLGLGKHAASKVRGNSRFVGGEQRRCSKQIDRILAGELVPMYRGQRQDAVVAEHPVPIQQPARLVYDLSTGRMRWKPARVAPAPVLPGFATALRKLTDDHP